LTYLLNLKNTKQKFNSWSERKTLAPFLFWQADQFFLQKVDKIVHLLTGKAKSWKLVGEQVSGNLLHHKLYFVNLIFKVYFCSKFSNLMRSFLFIFLIGNFYYTMLNPEASYCYKEK